MFFVVAHIGMHSAELARRLFAMTGDKTALVILIHAGNERLIWPLDSDAMRRE